MKKKFYSIFALILSIVLSLSLLSGCGGKDNSGDQSDAGDTGDALTMEIAGDAWEVDGTVYHFFEGGVVVVDTGYILAYSWDGSYGEITDGGITAAMIYDEDGFFLEGEDELYYILSGRAETNDNGTVRELVPGDSTLTRSGEGHSIKAVGTENLELLATIVAHS